ncbi:YeaC family protein [Ferrimonas senticii]|uniref:YeaC family protein n=1 Tax=Ferrimonas senticii TaxID=394566 RepID=UPI0004035E4B|nr:DUF1315 family protein [Ferrimonas senticii]
MELQQMIDSLTPEVLQRLQDGVETGKWPDGSLLTEKQRENAMQALMLWQAKYGDNQDHLTINRDGEIIHLSKAQQKHQFDDNRIDVEQQP